jgi:hypothetical protein
MKYYIVEHYNSKPGVWVTSPLGKTYSKEEMIARLEHHPDPYLNKKKLRIVGLEVVEIIEVPE